MVFQANTLVGGSRLSSLWRLRLRLRNRHEWLRAFSFIGDGQTYIIAMSCESWWRRRRRVSSHRSFLCFQVVFWYVGSIHRGRSLSRVVASCSSISIPSSSSFRVCSSDSSSSSGSGSGGCRKGRSPLLLKTAQKARWEYTQMYPLFPAQLPRRNGRRVLDLQLSCW